MTSKEGEREKRKKGNMNEEKTRYLDSDFILANIFWMGRAYTHPPAGSGLRQRIMMMMKKHDLFAFTGSATLFSLLA
jgi:hypothetical protein